MMFLHSLFILSMTSLVIATYNSQGHGPDRLDYIDKLCKIVYSFKNIGYSNKRLTLIILKTNLRAYMHVVYQVWIVMI
jgi:hypothetical protein